MKKAFLLFTFVCFAQQFLLAQTTIYINSNTGNDNTGSGTSANPYKTFHKGYTAAIAGSTLDLTGIFTWTDADETGDAVSSGYTINKQLTIRGRSAGQTFLQAAATANTADRRVLTLGNYQITIRNLTIRYGHLNTNVLYGGAGVFIGAVSNNIKFEDCNIEYNAFTYNGSGQWYGGGGIAINNTNTNATDITFNRCNVRNNSSAGNGAAIWSYRGVSGAMKIHLTNSTFNNNTSTGSGATIFSYYAYYQFTNTTITGNTANRIVSISWDGAAYFTNTTIAYNNIGTGGSAVGLSGTTGSTSVYIKNSIFAQNKRPDNVQADINIGSVTLINNGNNIVETQNSAVFTNGTNGDIVGIQPNLNLSSTLASNNAIHGTHTLALQFGSIAINAGSTGTNGIPNVTATDQRGLSRVGVPDIGAAEYTKDTWSGNYGFEYNIPMNWKELSVPAANADITIPAGLSNYPVLYQNTSTGSINLGSGAHISLNVYNLTMNGKIIGDGFFKGNALASISFIGTGEMGVLKFDQSNPGNSDKINSLTINRSAKDLLILGSEIFVEELTLTSGIIDLNNYALTASDITGGSASSYLKTSGSGKLKTIISQGSDFTFPVGQSAYNPVTIFNNSGADDEFIMGVWDEVLQQGNSGNSIAGAFVQRTWDIGKLNPNAGDGINLTFNWNNGEESTTINTPALFHYGTDWIKQTGTTNSTANSLTYTGYTGSFSPFAIADANAILPVVWLDFSADRRQETILLQWKTAAEQNSKEFVVQHRVGTNNWSTIGTVTAAGNSNTITNYQFTHSQPASGNNNYRLVQRDDDDRETISKILTVVFPTPSARIVVYPTVITNGLVNIKLPAASTIRIFSSYGTVVMEQAGKEGMQILQLNQLTKGTYYLRSGNETVTILIQ